MLRADFLDALQRNACGLCNIELTPVGCTNLGARSGFMMFDRGIQRPSYLSLICTVCTHTCTYIYIYNIIKLYIYNYIYVIYIYISVCVCISMCVIRSDMGMAQNYIDERLIRRMWADVCPILEP